ncbi:MAG TPA: peptidylprolyl isomerase [Pilimelia sp.]|nr:peptidylprolyl isomerase [Pilimelia sp.]
MGSSKDRQRRLARAKLDRQMARRAAAARRKRQIWAGTAAGLSVLLIVVGAIWLFGGFDSEPDATAADEQCAWTPQQGDNLKDVGKPPTKGIPTSGTRPMTITTNSGVISAGLDTATSTCAVASFTHLSANTFFDNTKCHKLTPEGALQCGDPGDTGQGGPTYSFAGENVPSAPEPTPTPTPSGAPAPQTPLLYPRGTVALIPSTPGNFGSQFLIFFKDFTTDQPEYSIVGRVTSGLDVLDKIVKAGTVADDSGEKVKPKNDVVIQSLTVGEVVPTGAPSTPPATPPTAPPATPSPTAQS